MRPEAADALVTEVYSAVTDQGAWLRLVEATASETGCGVSIAFRKDRLPPVIFAHAGYPAGAVEDFVARHAVLCPWNDILSETRLLEPFVIEDAMPLASITYSRFYREWVVPNDLGGGVGVRIYENGDASSYLLMHCSAARAESEKTALLALLRTLAPHMRRSLELARRVHGAWDTGARAGAVRAAHATVVLESNMTALSMNAAMERLIAEGLCGLSASRRLRLHRPDDTAQLTAVIQEAAKGRRTLPWPHVMAIQLPGQAGPNVLELEPMDVGGEGAPTLPGILATAGQPPAFIVTLRARSMLRGPSVEQIRVGLGLTPKQAHAVWSLVNGEGIERQAIERGLSVDGVRWHFKNIYQRTGCSNQAELVRLVMSVFSPERS